MLVGRPNVGKSSLLNQLAGDDVAIVTPIAGTTRDAVHSPVEIHGIPLTIIDTAGLRPTDDPIEALGIERTWAAVARADLALVLVDAAAGGLVAEADAAILDALPAALPRLVVHNKIDLAGLPAGVDSARRAEGGDAARTQRAHLPVRENRCGRRSPATGNPRARRRARGHGRYVSRAGNAISMPCATPATHLASARAHFAAEKPPLELVAEDLRAAHTALAAITGEFTSDDLLGVIFSRFCIGK